jgi:hypothetical protein
MSEDQTKKILFQAMNNHSPDCGVPPCITNRDASATYYGYFENRHGEQFVFLHNRGDDYARVYNGRVYNGFDGWKRTDIAIKEETADEMKQQLRRQMTEAGLAHKATDQGMDATMAKSPHALATLLPNGKYLAIYNAVLTVEEKQWLRACWIAAMRLFPQSAEPPG